MRKFNLKMVALLVAGALVAGVWLGHAAASGVGATPGSEQDPLVTKSYVDQEIARAIANLPPQENGNGAPVLNSIPLQIVVVPAGQRLIGFEGTEFILRSGSGTIIASAAGGIPNLTQGRDLAGGVAIPANHHLLIPRSDQRGFRATTQLIVMVRGQWSIEP